MHRTVGQFKNDKIMITTPSSAMESRDTRVRSSSASTGLTVSWCASPRHVPEARGRTTWPEHPNAFSDE